MKFSQEKDEGLLSAESEIINDAWLMNLVRNSFADYTNNINFAQHSGFFRRNLKNKLIQSQEDSKWYS